MVYWGPMWAGSWVSEDLRSVKCDSEEMIEGITYLTDLVAKYRVMDKPGQLNDVFGTANARDLFFDGKLAFFRTSGGQTFAVAEAVKDGKPYGFAPIPKFGIVGSGQAVDPNGIINGAKHPDEGWEFIKWQADTPNWAITRGNAPSRQDHFTAWGEAVYGGFAEEARVEVYADSLGYAVEIDPVFSLPNWRIPIWRDMVGPAMTKLYNGEGDVKETLEQLRVQIEGEMPEFGVVAFAPAYDREVECRGVIELRRQVPQSRRGVTGDRDARASLSPTQDTADTGLERRNEENPTE